jgi:hypothetical protein
MPMARKVANEFEQMRHVFTVLLHTDDVDASAPLTIFATLDRKTFRELDPADDDKVAGSFLRGWESQYVLVRSDTWEGANRMVVYHEYTQSVLAAQEHWLPVWLAEGLAPNRHSIKAKSAYAGPKPSDVLSRCRRTQERSGPGTGITRRPAGTNPHLSAAYRQNDVWGTKL